ncbi:hypothetical protein B0J14DRAFT_482317 [Halenospora varia]|nr:hypothetical protein B0J14DRAFT_482317 [Halenospora varia]
MSAKAAKPRRPHHKSRNGCAQCKQKKVKCDEQKPTCKRCENYDQPCSFLQTHPQSTAKLAGFQSMLPSPTQTTITPSATSPFPSSFPPPTSEADHTTFSLLDLELLHYWITDASKGYCDFDECVELFQTTVISMAVEYPFLMHQLLSLSAHRLAILRPNEAEKYRNAEDNHAVIALALFRPQILNLTSENCHACFAFSNTTWMRAWAAQDLNKPSTLFFSPTNAVADEDDIHIQWAKLHRGQHGIVEKLFPVLIQGPLRPLFAPWLEDGPDSLNRPAPLKDDEKQHLDVLAEAWNNSSLSEAHKEILNTTLEGLVRVFSILSFEPRKSKLAAVMSWFSTMRYDFLGLMEEKVPEALLIVAYYCVPLKQLDHIWWLEGKGENLLRTIIDELQLNDGWDKWERWVQWPIEQVISVENRNTVSTQGQYSLPDTSTQEVQ